MTEPSRAEEVQAELLRAERSLQAAQSLLAKDFLEDALSRAYYAILHAARAVLLAENVTVSSHRSVRRLVPPGTRAGRETRARSRRVSCRHQDLSHQEDRLLIPAPWRCYVPFFHCARQTQVITKCDHLNDEVPCECHTMPSPQKQSLLFSASTLKNVSPPLRPTLRPPPSGAHLSSQ